MSFGLGYIADGLLKGQERNRNWGLRQKQEERSQAADQRAQESHGIGVRIGNVNADLAEEKMLPEAISRRQEEATLGLGIKQQNFDNAKAQGMGINQQNALRAEDLTPEAKQMRFQSKTADLETKQLKNQYQEYLNTSAGKKVSEEVLAWEKHLQEIINQTDEAEVKVKLSEAIDVKRYRMIQLIESGDMMGAALFVNGSRANEHENIASMQKTKEGGVVGYDIDGNVAINITPEEIKGVRTRMSQRSQKARAGKEPKVMTEKTYDSVGNVIGERPYVVKTDPQTGQTYKEYVEERKDTPVVSDDLKKEVALDAVRAGRLKPEKYEEWYGEKPNLGNVTPSSNDFPTEEQMNQNSFTVTSNVQPQQLAPRMGRGLIPSSDNSTPIQEEPQSNSPRNRQDVVGGLNDYLEKLFDQQDSAPSRTLSRR